MWFSSNCIFIFSYLLTEIDNKFFFKPDDNSFKTFSKVVFVVDIISIKLWPNIKSSFWFGNKFDIFDNSNEKLE